MGPTKTFDPLATYKVYLCGPVSGMPNLNREAFAQAERMVLDAGGYPINPLKSANDPAAEHEEAIHGRRAAGMPGWRRVIRRCLVELLQSDAVLVLSGWQTSRGAQLETAVAHSLGMPVYQLSEGGIVPLPIGTVDIKCRL